MKKVEMFKCEICNRLYNTSKEAIKCESKGVETPLASIGDTIEYLDRWNGGFGETWDTLILYNIEDKGHYINYYLGTKYDENTFYPERFVNGNDEFMDLCKVKSNN